MNKCSCGASDKEKCINESSHGYGKMCLMEKDVKPRWLSCAECSLTQLLQPCEACPNYRYSKNEY